MSEGTDSSTTSSEPEKPEQVSAPPEGKKRNLLPMILAIVVVALLVGVAVYYLFIVPPSDELSATITPDPCVVDAGKSVNVYVWGMFGDTNLSALASGVTYSWSVTPSTAGSFNLRAQKSVTFKAGNVETDGTLLCSVTYKGETVEASADLTINPPTFDQVLVTPSTKTVPPSGSQVFNATALSSVGEPLSVTFTWTVDGLTASQYTLNSTTGSSVLFTAGADEVTNVTLNATATYQGVTKTGSAAITIGGIPARSVAYRWYDMFNCPFNDAWYMRWKVYGEDEPLTTSYPYIEKWYGSPTGNIYYYASMRQNITGRNMPEISMLGNPWFIPLFGTVRGGTAIVDWDMFYPNYAQINATHANLWGNYEGYLVELIGNITLDRTAAQAVLGLTSAEFDNFANWWSLNSADIAIAYQGWLQRQSEQITPYYLDIYASYELEMNQLAFSLDAVKVGDSVVLKIDHVSWGMEMLMAKWLRQAFTGNEWYMDDFHMRAVIGPERTDLDLDAVCIWATYAYETTIVPTGSWHGTPCWDFEPLLQDLGRSKPPKHPHSDYDPYADKEYVTNAPGNPYYNGSMTFDYTPGIQNLSANDSFTFEWPSGQVPFYIHIAPNEVGTEWAEMTIDYAEPMGTDLVPNLTVAIDQTARTLTFTATGGDVDMWHWSQSQTAHENLMNEWDRLGLLPYGIPFIEMKEKTEVPPYAAKLEMSAVPSPILVDDTAQVTVTIRDQRNAAFPYTGTVHFSTNRPGEATLPADYTFTVGDAGVHVFTVSFNALENFTLQCTGLSDPTNLIATQSGIFVISEPEVITRFVVEGIANMAVEEKSDVTVKAIDQFGVVFNSYDGLITFSTNATAGMFTLPADYEFIAADKGQHTFTQAVSFIVPGTYIVEVMDVINTTAKGNQSGIVIAVAPEQTFTMYDLFEEPFDDVWAQRSVGYFQDFILFNETGKHAWLYDPGQDTARGVIYAPYRWNTTAKNMTSLSIDSPEFMPVFGPKNVPGASTEMSIYFTYLNYSWWEDYWNISWKSHPGWATSSLRDLYSVSIEDGYILGVTYNITMNRAAAETWLGMPQTGVTPADWWAANGATYRTNWINWIMNEGNDRLDIYCGYADKYYDEGTLLRLAELPDGNVSLEIGHGSWGYEVLMTRWLTESKVCTHEPYWEDFTLSAQYKPGLADVTFDAVGLYNFHAVKANESSTNGAAWVWEPAKVDYVASIGTHPSQFDPWAPLYYLSWNAGDPYFNYYTFYDATPSYFNLTSYQKLIVKLPEGSNVPGFKGEGAPADAIYNMLVNNDYSFYNYLKVNGSMSLGYYVTNPAGGGADLDSMYDSGTHTLTIQGPWDFEQVHHEGGPIYHGAPWIEFNVTPPGLLSAASTGSVEQTAVVSGESIVSEVAALATVFACVSVLVWMMAVGIRRRD